MVMFSISNSQMIRFRAGGCVRVRVWVQYMRCPIWRAANYMNSFANDKAFAYWFGRRNEDEQEVYHGGELRYVFNSASRDSVFTVAAVDITCAWRCSQTTSTSTHKERRLQGR